MDAVLLTDASNAFNSLNRASSLHSIRVLCPVMATYTINTYREPARLFIAGGKELRSVEGTTQGDPLAMSLYVVSLQPLITRLGVLSPAKQCWFADDATGAGSVEELKKWWDLRFVFDDIALVFFLNTVVKCIFMSCFFTGG